MGERFYTYKLTSLLPDNRYVVLDHKTRALVLFEDFEIKECSILLHVQFPLVKLLLDNYPDYAPMDAMLSAFYNREIEMVRRELNASISMQYYDSHVRPLRNTVSRTRGTVRLMGIEITGVYETGYLLTPYKPRRGSVNAKKTA